MRKAIIFGLPFMLTVLAAGSSRAQELSQNQAGSIVLGAVQGVVYYTQEGGGYRVVATLSEGADSTPMRFIVRLSPGEETVISVPQEVGRPELWVRLIRSGDHLLVTEGSGAVD